MKRFSIVLFVIISIVIFAFVLTSFSMKTQTGTFDINDEFIQEAIGYYELSKDLGCSSYGIPNHLESYDNEKKSFGVHIKYGKICMETMPYFKDRTLYYMTNETMLGLLKGGWGILFFQGKDMLIWL